jgi:hypothetical protein
MMMIRMINIKVKVVRQSPNQEEEEAKEDAQKKHCAKEELRVKEGPRGAEKLGPKNKINAKIDK